MEEWEDGKQESRRLEYWKSGNDRAVDYGYHKIAASRR